MRPPSLLRMTTNSAQWLSSTDQVLLGNIFNAYENTCTVARNTTLRNFPAVQHTSMHGFVNEMSSEFHVSIEYLKLVPQFNNLILDDRIRLIRNHIGTIIHINEPLMHPVAPINLVVTWNNILGFDITKRLLARHQIIEQYLVDPIILKVILIILVFSSSNSRNIDHTDMDLICDDSLSIFAAQNIYVELLWKYLLSCSPNEKYAVKFFNKLMMYILFAQNLHLEIDDYVDSLKHEIEQMNPMMQSMWPRTDDQEDIHNMTIGQDITL
ncbi:unnamed protein product [Rotaria sp. Silwood2]|nr:unnamed protein product [Rotaria sp. Silwood2]CAF2901385.1 unnamed protein product [Rotaria sp. Silwood2]CAF4298681.1 unnamed protein product [Rotaria sp. Silwood2]CAF4460662.1 unnamed protein product [Rotaria sp. Silwood2]CAF4545491.1 unnamed protein product [Rotaria sp. Silwood2]